MEFICQGFGAVAMVLLVLTYQADSRKKILLFHIAISVCWIFHYGLLSAYSALLINIICFIRNILFFYRDRKPFCSSTALPVFICALEICVTMQVFSGYADIFALIGAPLQTIALWSRKPRTTRFLMLMASPLWICYDYLHHSFTGILTETLVILSLLFSVIRYGSAKDRLH